MTRRIVGSLLAVTALGFATKYYGGPGAHWANNALAGMWYVVFWSLAAAWVAPRRPAAGIATVVFMVTAGLEFLQLWQPWWLQRIRSHIVGAALLGSTFTWWDIPYYAAGAGVGAFWIRAVRDHGADRASR